VNITEPSHKDDELLAIRCQLGEPAAFDELIARWHAPLWTYVRRLVGEDDAAPEVVPEIWVRVLRGIARLRDGSKLRAWLFGIARSTLMDRLREQYARPIEADIDTNEIPVDTWTDTGEEDLQALERVVGRLPLIEREVSKLMTATRRSVSRFDGADIRTAPGEALIDAGNDDAVVVQALTGHHVVPRAN
jgi:RNA polymerase sigma-70 factor (ECF subfamily)